MKVVERWRKIRGFEKLYLISDQGRVYSIGRFRHPARMMKPTLAGKGYLTVFLCDKEKRSRRYVHHLVLEAFIGRRPKGKEAAHNNGQPDDNRLSNLRWDTRSGNFADKKSHGTETIGERSGLARLREIDVYAIRSARGSFKEIGNRFGISTMQAWRIVNRKNWAHLP